MLSSSFTLTFVILLGLQTGLVLTKCVLYGYCSTSPRGLKLPCLYDGLPKVLSNSTGLKILEKFCPGFYNRTGDSYTCCNAEQLLSLEHQVLQSETVFGRCPSCMDNLANMICHSTCDPNMSDYIQVGGVAIDETSLERYVTEVIMYSSSNFLDSIYKSCSQVALPSLGKLAIDATCGVYTGKQCNPDRWFHFLGDPSLNPEAPMTINFKRLDTDFLSYSPINISIHRCSEAPKEGAASCSCIDCSESCPAVKDYPDSQFAFIILGLDGVVFIIICLYIVFVIILIFLKWKLKRVKQQKINKTSYIQHDERDCEHTNSQVEITKLNKYIGYAEDYLENLFFLLGKNVAENPTLVLAVFSWVIAICSYGFQYLDITSDPVQIWASPSSRSRIEKKYFEDNFEPFYRTEQIFFKARGLPKISHNTSAGVIEFGPAFHRDFLLTIFDLQKKIEEIPGFIDVCFAPLSNHGVKAEKKSQCLVESIFGYFSNDLTKFNKSSIDDKNFTVNYLDYAYKCLQSSASEECIAPYGGNVESALAVGGFLQYGDEAYEKADAIVVTYLLNNHLDGKDLKAAIQWENQFIDLLLNWVKNKKPDTMEVAFRAEISVEQEIAKESNAEAVTIVISYLIMFLYISVALGSFQSWRTLFINSKMLLGFGGIVVVMASVLSSIGIFGYIGTSTTLLTMEVIPFLILAVGVDNMFLIVNSCTKMMDQNKDIVLCIAESLRSIGPSLLLTTLSEAACFVIGAISDMPAVRTFALYAMMAILINFVLQLTVFVALLSLDLRRVKARRYDVLCCFSGTESNVTKKISWTEKFFQDFVVPVIFRNVINMIIFICFVSYFFISLAFIKFVEPGLEQRLSMPEDSYLNDYFLLMDDVFSIGPNVYFVLKPGLNFTHEDDQNLICGGLRCNVDSLSTQIYIASKQKDITYLRTSASSWLDDFFDWATIDGCCKVYPNGTFCPHSNSNCLPCNIQKNEDGMRPSNKSFQDFIPHFLRDNPDSSCAKAGHAAYGQGVNYEYDIHGNLQVLDSYFMAYHTPLKTSKDYYTALKMARSIAANITIMLNNKLGPGNEVEVFPYSIFYVFYEQYLTIWNTMLVSLCSSFAAIFVVTFVLTSFDIISSIVVLITVIMIVVDLAALMYFWNINLNAITLVNLVVATGISVEFCSHIVHSFGLSVQKTKKQRAEEALTKTGKSVFAGITLTKILGIIVLAFSKTKIFRVFYFRMYLGMVLFGAAHGLLFLPILLSYIGPCNKQRVELRKKRLRETLLRPPSNGCC